MSNEITNQQKEKIEVLLNNMAIDLQNTGKRVGWYFVMANWKKPEIINNTTAKEIQQAKDSVKTILIPGVAKETREKLAEILNIKNIPAEYSNIIDKMVLEANNNIDILGENKNTRWESARENLLKDLIYNTMPSVSAGSKPEEIKRRADFVDKLLSKISVSDEMLTLAIQDKKFYFKLKHIYSTEFKKQFGDTNGNLDYEKCNDINIQKYIINNTVTEKDSDINAYIIVSDVIEKLNITGQKSESQKAKVMTILQKKLASFDSNYLQENREKLIHSLSASLKANKQTSSVVKGFTIATEQVRIIAKDLEINYDIDVKRKSQEKALEKSFGESLFGIQQKLDRIAAEMSFTTSNSEKFKKAENTILKLGRQETDLITVTNLAGEKVPLSQVVDKLWEQLQALQKVQEKSIIKSPEKKRRASMSIIESVRGLIEKKEKIQKRSSLPLPSKTQKENEDKKEIVEKKPTESFNALNKKASLRKFQEIKKDRENKKENKTPTLKDFY